MQSTEQAFVAFRALSDRRAQSVAVNGRDGYLQSLMQATGLLTPSFICCIQLVQ